jgi:hypothetical protein
MVVLVEQCMGVVGNEELRFVGTRKALRLRSSGPQAFSQSPR